MKRQPVQAEEMPVFIGIDYHKAYSVYNVLNAQGDSLGKGRINHAHPEDFRALVRRWPGCRVVFEVGMNWHWLFEILERELSPERIVLANPFKTRVIAEAQIKTDKVDARILSDLLRARLISSVHVVGRESRQIKEVLRQRCFFVRQRIRRLPVANGCASCDTPSQPRNPWRIPLRNSRSCRPRFP
jgi:transposase